MSLGPGTLVAVTIQGEAKGVITADDLLAQVVKSLRDYPLTVTASSIAAGNPVLNAIQGNWLHYSYVAQLTISTPAFQFVDANDVGQSVANAFADVAGSTPTAQQAVIVSTEGTIAQPAGSNLIGSAGDALNAVGSKVSDFAANIQHDIVGLLLLAIGVIVLVIVALGWGKNTPALAGALR